MQRVDQGDKQRLHRYAFCHVDSGGAGGRVPDHRGRNARRTLMGRVIPLLARAASAVTTASRYPARGRGCRWFRDGASENPRLSRGIARERGVSVAAFGKPHGSHRRTRRGRRLA